MPPHWPHGDPDAVARAILAQPRYRIAPQNSGAPEESFWEALFAYLGHLLKPLLNWLNGAAAVGKPLGLGVGLLLTAVILAGLAFLIVRIVNAIAFAKPGSAKLRAVGSVLPGRARNAAQWRAAAERAAAAGDYAGAIAALFSAALAALDERALVAYDPTRTPGEYRRLLRRAAAAHGDPFDALSETFVRAAFDDRPVTGDDYARALHAYDVLGRDSAST